MGGRRQPIPCESEGIGANLKKSWAPSWKLSHMEIQFKESLLIRRLSIFSLLRAICVFAAAAPSVSHAQSVLTHHVRDAVGSGVAQPIGALRSDQIMKLDVVLPLRDPAGLERFLRDVYSPDSPNYRRFLSVPDFTARFGPTQQDYDAVVRFAEASGLTVTGGTRDGMDVQVTGPVSAIEAAFHVTMRTYRHPTENRSFYSPDQEPAHGLPFNLWHVSGLDSYSIPRPLFVNRSDFAKANHVSPSALVAHATTGSGPSSSFLGSDMRAAYYAGGALTGAGQNLGLLEYLGTDLADLNTYYANTGQTNHVPITLLSTDGTSTNCTYPACDDTEQTLDMTQALGMAPNLASLVVYVGSSDTAIISAMTTHNPLPATIGCSWGWTPVDQSTLDPYFKKMAAQGQNFFAASGDSSTWSQTVVAWPADDPYVVSVGGTDLVTSGAAGPWQSETAWVDSGGGKSPDGIAIPAWQQLAGVINSSNRGSTTVRNGPDVSANANFTFYVCADQSACTANSYGGTSFAAPMWAGYIALVNQQLAINGKAPIGFLNPTIYAQNVTSSYAADFHDITSGTSGSYSAVPGYDLVTGWGSPNSGLIAALVGPQAPSFSLSASASTTSVGQGNSANSTLTVSSSNGYNSPVGLTVGGCPGNTTCTLNPTSVTPPANGTTTSVLTIATTSSSPTGTYSLTISGNSGVQTTTVSVTITAPMGNFSISAPSTTSVSRGSHTTATISLAGIGAGSGVTLSTTGLPSRVTAKYSPNPAPASGTSTMTITASRRATAGTFTVTITGNNGIYGHSTTTTLTVH